MCRGEEEQGNPAGKAAWNGNRQRVKPSRPPSQIGTDNDRGFKLIKFRGKGNLGDEG